MLPALMPSYQTKGWRRTLKRLRKYNNEKRGTAKSDERLRGEHAGGPYPDISGNASNWMFISSF